jgi:hypothetical protein
MAASVDASFAFVAASVLRAARLQRAACVAVLADDSRPAAHGLAQHLDRAYEAIAHHVAQRQAQFAVAPDDAVKENAVVEMRQLVWRVRDLQTNLAWLEAASHPPIDLGTAYYVEDAARALVARNAEVTVVATEHRSYATTSNPFDALVRVWGKPPPPDEPVVVVVFIPRREQHSGLLHPLIVHELGHAADSAHGLVDRIWTTARSRKRLAARFSKAASAFAKDEKIDPSEATDHIAERLRAWITESFCDAFATHQLGPTYLYSFVAEVVAASIDDPGPIHPPPRQRVRHIVEQLDRLGWTDFMANNDSQLDHWIRELTARGPTYGGVPAFLTWAIDDLRAVIRKEVERHLRERIFRPDADELDEVSQLLAFRVPPAQRRATSAAVAPASIMLCCWHAALQGAGGGPSALAVAADAEELAELLPTALELSALVNSWS